MRISVDALIAEDKLVRYLLVWRSADDKSQFLAQAGFTLDSPEALRRALRALAVTTIWLRVRADGSYRFITLKPRKGQGTWE